jgi:tripartite-type tricarboxylate transporter receptor subunit TctC
MFTHRHVLRALAVAGVVAGSLAGASRQASSQEVSFKGKTARVIVGYEAGGGYDVYARILARYYGNHLPGKPNVIVQNMIGAGSVLAVNYIYERAPKDGSQFATFSRTVPLLAFSGDQKGIRFDPLKLSWIGTSSSYADDAYIMMVRKDRGVTTVADLRGRKQPLKFASTGFGSTGHDIPLVLRETLDLNIQVVHGYPGGATLYLAVERGEMDGRMVGYSSIKSAQPQWLEKDSKVMPLLQFARETRHPDLQNVPTARELASKPEDKSLIEMMESTYFLARPYAGPPGIPAANLRVVRAAFMAAHKDPGYVAEAQKLRIDVSPWDGEKVAGIVQSLARIPRDLYARYDRILANPKSAPRQVNWQIVDGKISKLAKKGRFEFEAAGKTHKSRVSSGYTKLSVDGKTAKSSALKEGMSCKIWYEGDNSDAGQMECK